METFIEPRPLVDNPDYPEQKRKALLELDLFEIDAPIAGIITAMAKIPHCFTLQSCYGHFLYDGQPDMHCLENLPVLSDSAKVEYRIAYVALCIENSGPGKALLQALEQLPLLEPEYIQWGSAQWFWQRQVNSYALQVEPVRHKTKDKCVIDYKEALHIEKVKTTFFDQFKQLIQKQLRQL